MLAWLLAGILVLHGVAHLVGFVAPWRLVEMTEMPYKTTVLGGMIDLGDKGIRVAGVLWLIAAIAFVTCAVGLLNEAPWWWELTLATVGGSLILTVAEWPASRIGVFVNLALLAVVLLDIRFGWLPPA